jgi:hypothetical protein
MLHFLKCFVNKWKMIIENFDSLIQASLAKLQNAFTQDIQLKFGRKCKNDPQLFCV